MAYTWDPDALEGLPEKVEPFQVAEVLSGRLLRRWLASDVLAVLGLTMDAQHVAIFLSEGTEPGEWVIEGARLMFPAEAKVYDEFVKGRRQ